MLNNHLIEVYNADSIHNGLIFDPQDHAQRPQNLCLRTCCGSVTAINPPKTWYHCTVACLYHEEAADSLVEFLNVDNIHNGPIYLTHWTVLRETLKLVSQDLLLLWAPDGKYFTAKTWCHFIQFCLHIMWRLNDSITAGMYGRTVVQQETKLSGQGRTISTSTSANCGMGTKSAKTLCHCI